MIRLTLCMAAACLALASPALARPAEAPADKAATLNTLLDEAMAENPGVPAMAVLVIRNGAVAEQAVRGVRALDAAVHGSVGGFDSPFEEAVARALAEKGWELHPQVGVSRFRIDLGVVDPDAPGRYLAGIECDGATYHRSATARDRDKIRESVLRGLGWEILRLWSTDYWLDPQGTLDKLDQQLRKLLERQRAKAQG